MMSALLFGKSTESELATPLLNNTPICTLHPALDLDHTARGDDDDDDDGDGADISRDPLASHPLCGHRNRIIIINMFAHTEI